MAKRKNLQALKEELSSEFEDFATKILACKNEEELSQVLIEALASVTKGNQTICQISK